MQLDNISSKTYSGKSKKDSKANSSGLGSRVVSNFIKSNVVDILTSIGIGVCKAGTYLALALGSHPVFLSTKLCYLRVLVVGIIVAVVHTAGYAVLRNNTFRRIGKGNSIGLGEDAIVVFLGTEFILEHSEVDSLPVLGTLGTYKVLIVLISRFNLTTLEIFLKVKIEIVAVVLLVKSKN